MSAGTHLTRVSRYPAGAYMTMIPPVGTPGIGWNQRALREHFYGRASGGRSVDYFVMGCSALNPQYRPIGSVPGARTSTRPDYWVAPMPAGGIPVPTALILMGRNLMLETDP